MRKLLRLVDALGARHDCAIILVHHTRKDASTGGFDAVRGASALRGWFDTGLMLSGDAAQPVASYECRNAAALPAMLLEKTAQGRFIPCTLTDEASASADPTIRGVMPGNASRTPPYANQNTHRPTKRPPPTNPTKTDQHRLTAAEIVRRHQTIQFNVLTDNLMKTAQIHRTMATRVIAAMVEDGQLNRVKIGRDSVYTLPQNPAEPYPTNDQPPTAKRQNDPDPSA